MKSQLIFKFCVKCIPAILAGILFTSCEDDSGLSNKVDFDRKAMLTNWADNILLPAFAQFDEEAEKLAIATKQFATKSDAKSLEALQSQFAQTYLSFQHITAFEAGPSEDIALRASLNTFPADTVKIQNNISQGNYNLQSASNLSAKGFPAVDFLLYGKSVDLDDPNTITYLITLTDDIAALASNCADQWQASRTDFISASGTDLGSSLGQMVNAINKDYELIKNAKIGFPAGKKTLGKAYPHTCEAYFSGQSIPLIKENIIAIRDFYQGWNNDHTHKGSSLEDYLDALQTDSDQGKLSEVIADNFTKAIDALSLLENSLPSAIENQSSLVDDAYLKIQQNVRYLKVDMPSAMGVLITYQDNDGD